MYTHNRRTDSERIALACILFVGIVLRARSLLRLLPGSELHPRDAESTFDLASIATVSRSLMESCYVFFSLAVEDVAEDERQARILVAQLHEVVESRTMFRKLGDGGSSEDKQLTARIRELRLQIEDNAYMRSLDAEKLEVLQQGSTPLLGSMQDISEYYLDDRDFARFLYKWLSNYTHSHPFAYFRTSPERGRGIENSAEAKLASLILEQCSEHLILCCQQFLDLVPELSDKVDSLIRKAVSKDSGGDHDMEEPQES